MHQPMHTEKYFYLSIFTLLQVSDHYIEIFLQNFKTWHGCCIIHGNTARLIRQLSSIIPFLDQGYLIEVWPFFCPFYLKLLYSFAEICSSVNVKILCTAGASNGLKSLLARFVLSQTLFLRILLPLLEPSI